ncbi:chorismate-binding protein [Seonamhaeicola sp. ML3]|uniref:chorismate-binding protein n=1 Tax=Seonamhaeicola sp. ML3 TaxID=2937786 RepID=UPI00200E2281|nr:chorismate-binding protein [Seonamhaeicola sp. ML3]
MTKTDFFNSVFEHYGSQLPFVIYKKPNTTEVKGLLQESDTLIITEEFTEKGFVFSPFDDREDSVLIPLQDSKEISHNHVIEPTKSESRTKNPKADISAKNQHIDLVNNGVKAIKEGAFQKVVLSRKETILLKETHPISIFKNLLNTYPSAFVYCWYHPKVGLWLGATPETLLKIEANRFSIMALAGTQVYKGTLDVNWEDKEIQEQKVVTDFIVESLKNTTEKIKVSNTNTVKAGSLLHLKTMISAQLKSTSRLKEILNTIHPTPAVCGYPKQTAKNFILKHENYHRAYYTGFLGELNYDFKMAPRSSKRNIENRAYSITKKSTQLYVNLRCMQLQGDEAIIYIGGGITHNSIPEKEWEETVAKSLIIKNVLYP